MPGRVSGRGRGARASAATSSTRTRRTARARASADAVEIPDEGESTSLREHICRVFADAQRTTATQRKLVVTLRKIQETCCYEPVKPRKHQSDEDFGEEEFNNEVGRCLLRMLPVKKSEPVGDRILRFIGIFLKHASDKDNAIATGGDPDAAEAIPETPSSRLTSHILSLILPLLMAKDKVVRFRATQIIAHIVNTLDSIDDELFQYIRLGLLKRLRDKESTIRVQAVLGLGRLADDGDDQEDEDSDDETASGLLEKLLDVLQNDSSADVRRALLLNLPLTPTTLPYLLERARDQDPGTRRALYSKLLPALGDFRHLSLNLREKLLRWGIRDRDENVRKATARLFRERWIEDCAGLPEGAEEGAHGVKQLSKPSYDALLELLERVDVVNSGNEGGAAHEAMKEFWDGRPDYREFITFDDAFWNDLSPESVFIARTFNDYCKNSGDSRLQSMLEDKMPEVTKYGYLIQKHINTLIEGAQKVALEEDPDAEEDTVQQEFCVEHLLHIALTLDYTDEIGRRKMFSTMREALAISHLPEECTKLVVEVLRSVCGPNTSGEREFCEIVLEAIADVHDTIMGDDDTKTEASFHSARSDVNDAEATPTSEKRKRIKPGMTEEEQDAMEEDKAVREIMVNMKCLHIAQCMLQNVHCDLESNHVLVTMLNNLVVPAVRSQEVPVRERGFLCLGLCCILSKNIAQENLALFLHCFAKGHEALQTIAIQIITDILTTHPSLIASPEPPPDVSVADATEVPNPLLKPILKMYLRALKSSEVQVATSGAVAASKLMLLNILRDSDLLRWLTVAYFNPESQQNPGLRQALTYFLPVYCHSRKENAERMASIAVPIVHALMSVQEELDEEGDVEMVGLGVVGSQIVDWTDPRKLVGVEELGTVLEGTSGRRVEAAGDPHLVLAEELLEKSLTHGTTKEEKKIYLSMLSKLHVHPMSFTPEKLQSVSDLVTEAQDSKVAADATSRNALAKLANAVWKAGLSVHGGSERPEDATVVQGEAEKEASMEKDDDASVGEATASAEPEETPDPDAGAGADAGTGAEDDDDDDAASSSAATPRPPEPRAMSIEEQIQQQLAEETMAEVDAEGTVYGNEEEEDGDDDDDDDDDDEEEEGKEQASESSSDDESTIVVAMPPAPTPARTPASAAKAKAKTKEKEKAPAVQPRGRGRPRAAPAPAAAAAPAAPARGRGRPSTKAKAKESASRDVVDELLDSDVEMMDV